MSHSNSDNWIRRFDVSDPERHSKGFTVYKITSVVFPKNCPEAATRVIVWKRYKNFLKLHNDLKQCHEELHLKVPFPPFPKAKFFGRFDEEVVEQRRQAALVFLQFVADVPILFTSQPFVKFFETGYSVATNSPVLIKPNESNNGSQSPNTATPDSSDSATSPDSRSTSPSGGKPTWAKSNRVDLGTSIQKKCGDPNDAGFSPLPATLSHVSADQGSGNVQLVLSSPTQSETSREVAGAQDDLEGDSSRSDRPETLLGRGGDKKEREATCETESVSEKNDSKEARTVSEQESGHVDKAASGLYITEAAYHLGLAAEHEAADNMEAAFAAYKAGIACLLSGVKDDPDEERADLVRSKTACYLLRAEKIYQAHLLDTSKPSHSQGTGRCLLLPLCDLKYYKVFGVTSSVILTRNTQDRHTYVIKVLHKSPCPVDGRLRSTLPANVPFMCRLYACFENESSVFLVLQHAACGLLWDHVNAYLNSPENGPDSPPYIDQVVTAPKKNKNRPLQKKRDERVPRQADPNPLDPQTNSSPADRNHPRVISQSHPIESQPTLTLATPKPKPTINIPEVILPDSQPDPPRVSPPADPIIPDPSSVRSESHDFLIPQTPEDPSLAVGGAEDADTTHLLENAHRLLESVSRSLTNIEGVSNQAGATLETQLQVQKERRRPRKLAALSPAGRSQDRSRRNSAVRKSRWEKKFSCDDMFEGRARALSGSLDREAQWLRMAASTPITPRIPMATIRSWAAQLLLALEALHRWGIIIGDLHPDNIMLTSSAVLMLTYQCCWVSVDRVPSQDAIDHLYAAPEVSGIGPISVAADWWSFGVLLFELLSGESFANRHPGGFFSHSVLDIPSNMPSDAADLLSKLVRHVPSERLGNGPNGVQSIKDHEFFKTIDWRNILLLSATV